MKEDEAFPIQMLSNEEVLSMRNISCMNEIN